MVLKINMVTPWNRSDGNYYYSRGLLKGFSRQKKARVSIVSILAKNNPIYFWRLGQQAARNAVRGDSGTDGAGAGQGEHAVRHPEMLACGSGAEAPPSRRCNRATDWIER